jgi:cytoskeletal protein RodZ
MDNFVRFGANNSNSNGGEPEKKLAEQAAIREAREAAAERKPTHVSKPQRKIRKSPLKVVIIVAVAVVVVGLAVFAVYQYQQAEYLRTPEGIAEIAKRDSDALVGKVSQLIQLPDEEAVIATVDDKDKLKEQPFFADAENGDKVLIFSAASRAVIYRPSENRIINSGPIAITAEDAATDAQITPTE